MEQQHSIPQNIMSYEFKLIAGMTLKQFIFVAVGGAITFGLFMGVSKGFIPGIFGWPLLVIVVVSTIVIGLVKIQNRSMDAWLKDFTDAFKAPTRRLWKKSYQPVKADEGKNLKPEVFPEYLKVYFADPEDMEDELQNLEAAIKNRDKQTNTAQAGGAAAPNNQSAATQAPAAVESNQNWVVSSANASQYALDNQRLLKQPNVSAYQLVTHEGTPLANTVGYLKDQAGQVIQVLRANNSGVVFFDKQLPNGSYHVDFQAEGFAFPHIQLVLNGERLPVIKVPVLK